MSQTVETLILDLLEWLAARERSYRETMDAWRTSCPRLTVWEDANERGLVCVRDREGFSLVEVTLTGLELLRKSRPEGVPLRLSSVTTSQAQACCA
jgi:hypothetical protein